MNTNATRSDEKIEVFVPRKPVKSGRMLTVREKEIIRSRADLSVISKKNFDSLEEYEYYRSYVSERNKIMRKYYRIKENVSSLKQFLLNNANVIKKVIMAIIVTIFVIAAVDIVGPFVSATMQDKSWPVRVEYDDGQVLWSTAIYETSDGMMYKIYHPVRIEEGRYVRQRKEIYMTLPQYNPDWQKVHGK